MYVKQLKDEKHFEAGRISMICFHDRIDNPEEKKKEVAQEKEYEDWGAFTDEHILMARIINNRFSTWLDGQLIEGSGIGAVSTLPEYRGHGAIRAIFRELLPYARSSGAVISSLYPFNHAFYRKFGYETAMWKYSYTFSPAVLSEYRFEGTAELWQPGQSVMEYTALYSAFSRQFNMAIERSPETMLNDFVKGEYYKDRKFCYLLREKGQPIAYIIFQDIRHDPQAILSVKDLAWSGRQGFLAILGFLGRFSADYGSIVLPLPASVNLLNIIHSPLAYDIQKEPCQDFMVRVINVPKLLSLMKKPDGAAFTMKVQDELLPDNTGTWKVRGDNVTLTDENPDIEMSEKALSQLAVGAISLGEALLRSDVTLYANEDLLRQIFTLKAIWTGKYY